MRWQNAALQIVTTEQLLVAYNALVPTNPNESDLLFQHFGPGNIRSVSEPLMHLIDKPYERLVVYEHIMHELQVADHVKYAQIHKGTPYFFISWLAFTVKDFEKAIFYMDSAIAEDIQTTSLSTNPNAWQTTPAAKFLLLDANNIGMEARSIVNRITTEFEQQLTRFNSDSGATLTLTQFRDNLVLPNMQDHSFRSIISGLYVFIMEYVDRTYMLRLKSSHGGSIEPFIVHLFKGCLIFESLLKTEYGGTRNTLGGYLSATKALTDLEIGQGSYAGNPLYHRDQPRGGYTLSAVLGLLPSWRNENYKERIVAVSFGIRNTAGHDLSWPVTFDEVTYQEIYRNIIDSILWFIWKVKI